MAIFLIMDRNKVNVLDAAKDVRGCYKFGDIVEVFEDDKPLVIPPAEPFYIVKVTGLSKDAALKYMEPQYDTTTETVDGVSREKQVMVRRRLYHIPIDLLPRAVNTALTEKRYYETTWATVSKYLTNKITQPYLIRHP